MEEQGIIKTEVPQTLPTPPQAPTFRGFYTHSLSMEICD